MWQAHLLEKKNAMTEPILLLTSGSLPYLHMPAHAEDFFDVFESKRKKNGAIFHDCF